MTTIKGTVPAWKRSTILTRALDCATFLICQGFITDAEREKIHKRMVRRFKRGQP